MGWTEDDFDFLMQWLRCVLLKHGASLVYTSSFDSNNIRTLLHSSLSIHSLLKRETAKHNVIDRDKTLVPPNWDSWGKIRILKEGFDPEIVSEMWSIEIQEKPEENFNVTPATSKEPSMKSVSAEKASTAVSLFESTLPRPSTSNSFMSVSTKASTTTEVIKAPTVQEFLQSQAPILEAYKAEDEKEARRSRKGAPSPSSTNLSSNTESDFNARSSALVNPRTAEHIGPYQINVNGIDFDADEATRRIRERESERSATLPNSTISTNATRLDSRSASGLSTPTRRDPSAAPAGRGSSEGGIDSNKPSNEALAGFFANLIKKGERNTSGRAGSGTGSERGGLSGAVSPSRNPAGTARDGRAADSGT